MEKKERTNVTHACDGCRRRKMRCEPVGGETGQQVQCKACRSIGSSCTFDVPANRRGPRPKKHNHVSDLSKDPATQQQRHNSISTELSYTESIPPIDSIMPPEVFNQIIQDYLERQYPIHPLIHIPTFKSQLASNQHQTHPKFFSFTISLCASFCACLPLRFIQYQTLSPQFKAQYPTLRSFVKRLHFLIQRQRDADWHENLSMLDWALACTLFMSHACIGQSSSARMYKAEMTAIVMERVGMGKLGMGMGDDEVDLVEVQLMKKAFWITVAAHICVRITGESLETLSDRSVFEQADAETLAILPLDDQYITSSAILVPPPGELQITAGFAQITILIKTMAAITKDPTQPKAVTCSLSGPGIRRGSVVESVSESIREKLGECVGCGRTIRTAPRLLVFQDRLKKVQSCLQDLPPQLRPEYMFVAGWSSDSSPGSERAVDIEEARLRERHIEILRTNLHVEHLWMQNVLIERLSMASKTENDGVLELGHSQKEIWDMREEVCEKLLGVLYGVQGEFVEPNGHALILKIRQIAASLLDFQPTEDEAQMEIVRSAQMCFKRFTDVLKRLDGSYLHGKVIDMNIVNQQHMALAGTPPNSGSAG